MGQPLRHQPQRLQRQKAKEREKVPPAPPLLGAKAKAVEKGEIPHDQPAVLVRFATTSRKRVAATSPTASTPIPKAQAHAVKDLVADGVRQKAAARAREKGPDRNLAQEMAHRVQPFPVSTLLPAPARTATSVVSRTQNLPHLLKLTRVVSRRSETLLAIHHAPVDHHLLVALRQRANPTRRPCLAFCQTCCWPLHRTLPNT